MALVGISWPERVYRYPAPGTWLPLLNTADTPLVQGINANAA